MCYHFSRRKSISTHAPRTGSDEYGVFHNLQKRLFQPTLPARGATIYHGSNRIARTDFNPRSPHGERQSRSRESME